MIYSPDRFLMPKIYQTTDLSILGDYQKLTDFVKSILKGEQSQYWETDKQHKVKHS